MLAEHWPTRGQQHRARCQSKGSCHTAQAIANYSVCSALGSVGALAASTWRDGLGHFGHCGTRGGCEQPRDSSQEDQDREGGRLGVAVGDGGNNSVDHLQHLRRARCSRDAQRRPGHQSHACSTDASAKALELAGIRRGTDTMQQDPKCCQTHHTWENKAKSSSKTAQNACLQRSDRYRHLVRRWVGLVWFCIRRSMPPISKGDHVLLNMCRDNAVMAAVQGLMRRQRYGACYLDVCRALY